MSKNFAYPPEYWKLKKENEINRQECKLLLQMRTCYEELVRLDEELKQLKDERINLWISDLPPDGLSGPIPEGCHVIKFSPCQNQQKE